MKTITIRWATQDILAVAENMTIQLTEQEADKILESMQKYYDSEFGINWGVIESYIQDFIQTKKYFKKADNIINN
jgi:hypothetical protein